MAGEAESWPEDDEAACFVSRGNADPQEGEVQLGDNYAQHPEAAANISSWDWQCQDLHKYKQMEEMEEARLAEAAEKLRSESRREAIPNKVPKLPRRRERETHRVTASAGAGERVEAALTDAREERTLVHWFTHFLVLHTSWPQEAHH